jgi:signal transduction histidine kinase
MPKNGRLKLAAWPNGDSVDLQITNSDVGIAPEDLNRVFDPLFTTKPPGKSTNLGLPILREIVEAHKNTIRLVSRPDKNTTAVVRLPPAAKKG